MTENLFSIRGALLWDLTGVICLQWGQEGCEGDRALLGVCVLEPLQFIRGTVSHSPLCPCYFLQKKASERGSSQS